MTVAACGVHNDSAIVYTCTKNNIRLSYIFLWWTFLTSVTDNDVMKRRNAWRPLPTHFLRHEMNFNIWLRGDDCGVMHLRQQPQIYFH